MATEEMLQHYKIFERVLLNFQKDKVKSFYNCSYLKLFWFCHFKRTH